MHASLFRMSLLPTLYLNNKSVLLLTSYLKSKFLNSRKPLQHFCNYLKCCKLNEKRVFEISGNPKRRCTRNKQGGGYKKKNSLYFVFGQYLKNNVANRFLVKIQVSIRYWKSYISLNIQLFDQSLQRFCEIQNCTFSTIAIPHQKHQFQIRITPWKSDMNFGQPQRLFTSEVRTPFKKKSF